MSMNQRPVFFDSRGRRARATNVILAVIAFAATSGLGIVGLGLFIAPSLPKLAAPSTESHQVIDAPSQALSRRPELQITPARSRQIPEQALQTKRLAFFDDEDDAPNIPALKRHAADLDGIIPEWLALVQSEGPALRAVGSDERDDRARLLGRRGPECR